MYTIQVITPKQTHAIRKRILRDNRDDLSVDFTGDAEENTFHLGIFEKKQLVGISSYMRISNPSFEGLQYQLRGMALLEAYQGKGIGGRLLTAGIEQLKEQEVTLCWCNARTPAVAFYKAQGFQTFGEEFIIENAGPHMVMFKKL